MDWESGKQRLSGCITKYRYAILILLAGILIMTVPEPREEPVKTTAEVSCRDLQTQLAEILGKISGVGKVEVLLTEATGADTVYQVDENRNQMNRDTVIVMNSQREEAGLVKQVVPPEYRGAVIVCQGAENASVRLAVVEAVKSVTGLSSDRITVLKMK